MIEYVFCGVITPQEDPDRPGVLVGRLVRCVRDITHRGHHWRDVEPLPDGCSHTLKDVFCHCSRKVA